MSEPSTRTIMIFRRKRLRTVVGLSAVGAIFVLLCVGAILLFTRSGDGGSPAPSTTSTTTGPATG